MTRPSDRWIKNYKNSRMIWHLADDTAVLMFIWQKKNEIRRLAVNSDIGTKIWYTDTYDVREKIRC